MPVWLRAQKRLRLRCVNAPLKPINCVAFPIRPSTIWLRPASCVAFRTRLAVGRRRKLHPREFYSAIIEVARAEGCAGWVAGIIGVHPWQTALYSDETEFVLLRSYRQG